MIKVVFVLIVLSLSAIFAYLVLANKKGVSTPTTTNIAPDPSSESQESGKEEEDEDTSSTATAQPIETVPPEEPEVEEPGTCETTGDWAMSDECNADGTAIFTQTYKESKPGACPANEKARVKPCCYQKGDWKDISQCQATGKKTQEQTTVNCAENMKTREVDCEYIGPWQQVGGCNADGKQYYNRTTLNSPAEKTKTENCCYISPWGGWGDWGGCNGSKRYRTRNRIVVNCPSGTPTSETGSQNCNHCSGSWVNSGEYVSSYCTRKSNRPGAKKYKKVYHKQKYVISKNASNGGNACPHRSGETRTTDDVKREEKC